MPKIYEVTFGNLHTERMSKLMLSEPRLRTMARDAILLSVLASAEIEGEGLPYNDDIVLPPIELIPDELLITQ